MTPRLTTQFDAPLSPGANPAAVHRAVDTAEPAATASSRLDSVVIHDLLNPLTSVLGQLELLEDELASQVGGDAWLRLRECRASARELAEMLMDLRWLAQLEADEVPHRPSATSIRALLDRLRMPHAWPANGTVDVHASPPDHALAIRDCADLANRGLHVIVRTAMRLSPERRVTVTARPTDGAGVEIRCRYVGRTLPRPLGEKLRSPHLSLLQRQHGMRIDRVRGIELVHQIMRLLEGALRYEPSSDGGSFILAFQRDKEHELKILNS